MIKIEEITPLKISGLTSLKVEFSYNPAIIEELKKLDFYVYHKKAKVWEIPINSLSKLVDSLVYYDDIELKLLSSVKNKADKRNCPNYPLTEDEISQFKFKPYKHQIDGINFGLAHPKFLLLDGMGLGKTCQAIWLAETLKRRGQIDHCLIVCGIDNLRQNWKKEIAKFSTESCLVLGEKIAAKSGRISYDPIIKRAERLKQRIDEFFVVVNIATLRDDSIIEAFQKYSHINKFDFIVVDESHKALGNKSAQQANNLLKLQSKYKVAMTGTLLVNNPLSAWGSLSFTDNDKSTLTNFKGQYCEFGGFHNAQVLGYKNLPLLKEELDHCSIRRTFADIGDMPPQTVTYELVEMSEAHRKFYEAVKNGVKEEVDKIQLKSANLLALTTRLRQATACPELLTSQPIISSKVERCVEIVEDLIQQGEKVVIMSTFKEPVYQLGRLLESYNPLINTGDQDEDTVTKNVDLFQNNPQYKIFIATGAKCGTGITLNAASYMIMIDTPFTYSTFAQIRDRIYRVNNTRPAFITVLDCKDTVDERVAKIVETKKDLSDYIIDDKENALSRSLDNELRNILFNL